MKKLVFIFALFCSRATWSQDTFTVVHDFPHITKPVQVHLYPVHLEASDLGVVARAMAGAHLDIKNKFNLNVNIGSTLLEISDKRTVSSVVRADEPRDGVSYLGLNTTWYFHEKIVVKEQNIMLKDTNYGKGEAYTEETKVVRMHPYISRTWGLRAGITKQQSLVMFGDYPAYSMINVNDRSDRIDYVSFAEASSTYYDLMMLHAGMSFRRMVNAEYHFEKFGTKGTHAIREYALDVLYSQGSPYANISYDKKVWEVHEQYEDARIGWRFEYAYRRTIGDGPVVRMQVGSWPLSYAFSRAFYTLSLGWNLGVEVKKLTKKEAF